MENQPITSSPETTSIISASGNQSFLSTQSKTSLLIPILSTVLVSAAVFGFAGYMIGLKANNNNNISNYNSVVVPSQFATSTIQPSPTQAPVAVDNRTKLLESDLVSTIGWQTVSFSQNILASQGGETKPGKIEFKIPSKWTVESVKVNANNSKDCTQHNITSDDGNLLLIIKPSCGNSNNDYLPISGPVQIVKLSTKVGNGGNDAYAVRYLDISKNTYHYGSVDVSPGANIDIQKDKIYPNLILQYQPDRAEQWLWTSYDLTYKEGLAGKQTAMRNADTIITTLKLTD